MVGVRELEQFLKQRQMDARDLRQRLILAPTLRKRERWHTFCLLAHGWTALAMAGALDRDYHTIAMAGSFRLGRICGLDFLGML